MINLKGSCDRSEVFTSITAFFITKKEFIVGSKKVIIFNNIT